MASAEVTKRRPMKASARAPRVLKQIRSLPQDFRLGMNNNDSSMSPLEDLEEENLESNETESPYNSKIASMETKELKLEEDLNGVDLASSRISSQNESKWDDHSSCGAKKTPQAWFKLSNGDWALGKVVSTSGSESVISFPSGKVRSKLTSLDGIVPPTHGLTISSSGMNNVWLSMEHQTIVWCNQLVVQVSHTLLSTIDPATGQPFSSSQKRLSVFSKMLENAVPHALSLTRPKDYVHLVAHHVRRREFS